MKRSLFTKLGSVALLAIVGLHGFDALGFLNLQAELLVLLRIIGTGIVAGFAWQQRKLSAWIFAALFIGAEVGIDAPGVAIHLDIFSKAFIQLIKTVVAPLLFGTLVVGIAGHSNFGQVGRMGLKALVYFEIATTIALFIGLVAINISEAGKGIQAPKNSISSKIELPGSAFSASVDSSKGTYVLNYKGKELIPAAPKIQQDWKKVVLHTFPENISKMVYEGAILQVVVFSLLFGFGVAQLPDRHKKIMLDWTEALTEVIFRIVGYIMYLAPFAVGGAIAYTMATMGVGVVGNLLKLLGTLYGALIAFVLLVFVPVLMICRVPIKRFFQAVYEPAMLAFTTASSEAALPKAMTAMEQLGVPQKIVSFVLPTGYSFNLDGSTLYLALASVFCAQAAGIELSWGTQLVICLTLMLTSKGVAGVPRASLVILAATVEQFQIPEWPIAVILGIDALMDMGRTGTNVVGNCVASIVVARWEGELNITKPEY